MKNFLQPLLNAGITPQLTSQQARTVSFLNTLVLLVLLLIILNLPLPVIEAPQSSSAKLIVAVLSIHFILIAVTLLLNFSGRHTLARIYFALVAATFMTYALLMGTDSRWSFMLPIIIFLLFYIFPVEDKKWMYAVIAYYSICFIGLELWFVHHLALLSLPPGFVTKYKWVNTFAVLFCAIALGMPGYTIINRAEKKLAEEHLRSERLLLNILPASIAKRLKESTGIIADSHRNVSVLFADIVDFTKLSSNISPDKLVQLLNGIFSKFDELAEQFGLEKIKTIGDAYMIVAGLPEERNDHAETAAAMGLAMLDAIAKLNTTQEFKVSVQIGICSGPVIAGVIGKRKLSYDLWGDCVNTAARMESHGIAGEIQVTQSTFQLLENKYSFDSRGMIEVKGKGLMK